MFVTQHVKDATGATLAKEGTPSWSSSAKYIIIGDLFLMSSAGISFDANLDQLGYQIVRKGNSIFILAKDESAYQLAVIRFLDEFLGMLYLDADLVVYEKDDGTEMWNLPTQNILGEAPSVEYRREPQKWETSIDVYYGLGMTKSSEIFIPTRDDAGNSVTSGAHGDQQFHTSFYYISPSEYGASNPNYFSTNEIQVDGNGNVIYPETTQTQLCYTAHGNATDLAAMQEIVANKIVARALWNYDKNRDVIVFGAQDINIRCGCDACQTVVNKYGTLAMANLKFTNEVAKLVEQKLTAQGRADRKLTILFFAYQHASTPPNSVAVDENVSCYEGSVVKVGVLLASSKTNYSWKFTDDVNAVNAAEIQGWAQFCNDIYYWLYNNNVHDCFAPCNVFETTKDNLQFVIDNNAAMVYIQSSAENKRSPGFTSFKAYLESQLMVDITRSYEDIKNTYFQYYFGQGVAYMETFFDEMVAYMNQMRDAGNEDFYGKIVNQKCDQAKYWSLEQLTRWYDLCQDALDALDQTDANYEVYRRHILLEQMFPRYMLARYGKSNYFSYFENDETALTDYRKAFAADCYELDLIYYTNDGQSLTDLYSAWEILDYYNSLSSAN